MPRQYGSGRNFRWLANANHAAKMIFNSQEPDTLLTHIVCSMKKFLALLIICMVCALGMVQAQTTHINIPDTVCMSTTNSTSDQAKFTSINSYLDGSGISSISQASWTITTPSGTDADYNILYSANPSAVKATK